MTIVHPSFSDYVIMVTVGGPLGALAMYGVVGILNSAGWVKGNIILAIGDLFYRGKNAFWRGAIIHLGTSMAFAPLYLVILFRLSLTTLSRALVGGMFIGFFHGIFVTLGLVWVASNRPMLPEFTGARLPLALMHWVGHIAYGAMMGCIVSFLLRQ
ncbi:MAG: hypothetical protein ABIO94_04905 [Opitutaceae bacterium]